MVLGGVAGEILKMIGVDPASNRSKMKITESIVESVLQAWHAYVTITNASELLEFGEFDLNLTYYSFDLPTDFDVRRVLDELLANHSDGMAFIDQPFIGEVLAYNEPSDCACEERHLSGGDFASNRAAHLHETGLRLCKAGQHRRAQVYFSLASVARHDPVFEISRLTCRLKHLKDANGAMEEIDIADGPEDQRTPLSTVMSEWQRTFEVDVPWYLETEELIRRVIWAQAVYVKGEERRSVAYLEDIASYLKFCLDAMQASQGGVKICDYTEMPGEAARWIVSETIEFSQKIMRITDDLDLRHRVELVSRSLRPYFLELHNKSDMLG
ncbi:MAG: hypothetical protein M1587_00815 [Thaumarchaeota archaeon]|nr:hypothetical protein [Nitrososphaerota archaeon]